MINNSETKDSTYVEIESKRSGTSTYQELSVIMNQDLTKPETEKPYQNLELV